MDMFKTTLSQMLLMFMLILIGFALRKKSILPDNAYVTMSKLETWVFVPALNFSNMLKNFKVSTFSANASLILHGFAMIVIALIIAQPLAALFVKRKLHDSVQDYQRNIYRYAMTFGNYGFMGNFIIEGIWGSTMLSKYLMFTMIISIVCSSWGLYILIPKDKNVSFVKNITKGIITPPMIALVAGMICGILNLDRFIPGFVTNMLSNAKSCMGPVAMLLAGFVIGGFDVKKMLSNVKVYIATAVRLIVLPAIFVLAFKFLGASKDILIFTLIAFGTPLGLNTIVYPAAYGGDTKTGASMAIISHTICVVTIPAMYLLLIG